VQVSALAVVASLGPQVLDPRANRPSQPPPPRVPAEVTRDLLGLCSPTQFAVVLVLEDLVAIKGILKSLERLLQTLYTRLELLQPVLRIDVWRPRT
jgi:hypothetical protein